MNCYIVCITIVVVIIFIIAGLYFGKVIHLGSCPVNQQLLGVKGKWNPNFKNLVMVNLASEPSTSAQKVNCAINIIEQNMDPQFFLKWFLTDQSKYPADVKSQMDALEGLLDKTCGSK